VERYGVVVALALLGCGRIAPPVEASLLVGRAADAIALDPARITDTESVEVCEQVFETLVHTGSRGALEPALATHWEVSSDGTEWTFFLRPGVRFHDGTRFDADAVVFSFERQRDPHHPYHLNDFAYESLFKIVVRIEKLDALKVRIVIERAYAPFLANLSTFATAIVSPTAVRRWGELFRLHPVGTGPFRFVEWSRGERITLEANPSYWGGTPRLRHLAFVPVRDERQRLVALEGGAIDLAESLAPQDLQFIPLHPELATERAPGNNVGYLAINTGHQPLDDVRVRRAVAHAIHKTPIVKLVYQGLAVPASGPLPPSEWGRIELPAELYDPARARALLAEADYRPRTHPKLYVPSTPRTYLPDPLRVARMIQQDLRDVGMEIDLVVNGLDEHLRAITAGEHDLCLLGWSADNPDPDNFLYNLFDGDNAVPGTARNLSFFRDGQLDGILRWAQESLERERREQFYGEAQRILADRVPWVPLAHSEIVVARRRAVHGLVIDPLSVVRFAGVAVERAVQQ
jgi:peptide/nickel transport system substrate-binding protein